MKRNIAILLFATISLAASAQTSEFSSFNEEFESFREQINNEYADFLGQAWREFKIEKITEYEPSPITTPPIKQDTTTSSHELKVNTTEPLIVREPSPAKNKYLDIKIDDDLGKNINVEFYGAHLKLYYNTQPFTSKNPVTEQEVVAFWNELLESSYTLLLADLAKYKEELQLNDGAFYLMTKRVVNQITALTDDNQRVVFHLLLLIESGYDARIARVDNYLTLLLPTYEYIYGYPYSAEFDGQRYHLFTDKNIGTNSKISTYVIPHNIKRQSSLSFSFDKELQLPSKPHPFAIEYAELVVKGEINKNKIDFYNDYPVCDMSVYKHTGAEDKTEEQILSSLQIQLNDFNTYDAINKILSLVQYGFQYKKDSEQFGYERPLFVDEVLYYPFCDCEDRSVLLSYLVEKLFKLNTLLLDYPNHIAVAINIDPQGVGRYFKYKNKVYTCCDPTYMGSRLGDCMDMFNNVTPKLIE